MSDSLDDAIIAFRKNTLTITEDDSPLLKAVKLGSMATFGVGSLWLAAQILGEPGQFTSTLHEMTHCVQAAGIATAPLWSRAIYNTCFKIWAPDQTAKDLTQHRHLVGVTGSGKTTEMLWMFAQSVESGHGCFWVTTHGAHFPAQIAKDSPRLVVLPGDRGLNLLALEQNTEYERHLLADTTLRLIKRLIGGTIGSNMEELVYCATLAVLEAQPNPTLEHVYQFLFDDAYRDGILSRCTQPYIEDAFVTMVKESQEAVLRRLRRTMASQIIRKALCDPNGWNVMDLVDAEMIVVCDIDKGRLGPETAETLAEAVMTKLQLALLSRKETSPVFYVYCDEFQGYTNASLVEFMDEMRKRQVCVTLAHQHLHQLPQDMMKSVQQCGSHYFFRQIADDIPFASKLLRDKKDAEGLVNLPNYQALAVVMRWGVPRREKVRVEQLPIQRQAERPGGAQPPTGATVCDDKPGAPADLPQHQVGLDGLPAKVVPLTPGARRKGVAARPKHRGSALPGAED